MNAPEIEQLINKAESGDKQAMFALAHRYRDGDGVTADDQQSTHWFFRVVETGDEFALDEVRWMYRLREFVMLDHDDDIE